MTKSKFASQVNPGAKNIYCCDTCHRHLVTQDIDDGTTPFIIACQATVGCRGRMYSSLYRVFDPEDRLMPTHEWYKPGPLEIVKPHLAEHVRMGGLLMRPRDGRAPTNHRLVRHKKRGTIYRVIGEGKIQASRWFYKVADIAVPVDMCEMTIYEGEDGQVYVRPTSEFNDGRFEDL